MKNYLACTCLTSYKFFFLLYFPEKLKTQYFKAGLVPETLMTSRNSVCRFQNVNFSNSESSHPCDQGSTTVQAELICVPTFLEILSSPSKSWFMSFPLPHYSHPPKSIKNVNEPSKAILNFPASGLLSATSH